MMSIDELTAAVRARVLASGPLGHTVLIDLGEAGAIFVDGTATPAAVENDRREAETTLSLPAALLEEMLDGAASPTLAYMTGKLKVAGSLGVALKIAAAIEE